MGIKVLQADCASGDAFAEYDFGSAQSDPWYVQFDLMIPSATFTALAATYFTADVVELGSAQEDGIFVTGWATDRSVHPFSDGNKNYWTDQTPSNPVNGGFTPDAWHTIIISHVGGVITWNADGTDIFSYSVASTFDAIQVGGIFANGVASEVYYIDNLRVGTTPGGEEIACDDFESGGAWTSTTGAVSIVDDPLSTGGPSAGCTAVLRANFSGTPLFGAAPLSVAFTDLSQPGPSGPITGWNWDFGDGGTSTAQNPTHSYAAGGTYTVTLTVTGTSPDGTASKVAGNYVKVAALPTTIYAAHKSATSDLYTVDPSTGAMTSIGPIGSGMSGLAVDPLTGDLYGSTSGASANSESLYLIDISTGAGTLIGASGGFHIQMHDLAFDAFGQMWGVDTEGILYSIDKTTGVATEIGGDSGTYSGGFDFDASGQAWRVGNRNPSGGAAQTSTINTSNGTVVHVADMSDGNFLDAGKFGDRDVFWAGSPGQTSPGAQNLVIVDPPTGTVVLIAAFGSPSNVGGLALVYTPAPDFTVRLVPNTIAVSDGVSTLVRLDTHARGGDTETITLSATAPAGFTVTFPDNPITAGDTLVPIDIAVGSPANGTYTITIHCDGTINSHDVDLTVNVLSPGTVPGVHLAS